jgi:uncharacterized protein YbaR (Trm112 family)
MSPKELTVIRYSTCPKCEHEIPYLTHQCHPSGKLTILCPNCQHVYTIDRV